MASWRSALHIGHFFWSWPHSLQQTKCPQGRNTTVEEAQRKQGDALVSHRLRRYVNSREIPFLGSSIQTTQRVMSSTWVGFASSFPSAPMHGKHSISIIFITKKGETRYLGRENRSRWLPFACNEHGWGRESRMIHRKLGKWGWRCKIK